MKAWNSLLEALHSAWIDEMTERHPDPKPLLGLPTKIEGFAPPTEGQVKGLAVAPVLLAGGKGLALLAHERGTDEELLSIGKGLLARSKTEFAWHEIQPMVEPFESLLMSDAMELNARLTIWMPMTAATGRHWMGVTLR